MEENDYLCTQNSNFASPMDFKARFKRYHTTLSKMAEVLNLQQPDLTQRITRGSIKIEQIEVMAKACGVSLSEFVAEDDVLEELAPKELKLHFGGKEYTYELKK